MKIATVMFPDGHGHGDFERLLSAWRASVAINAPDADVEVVTGERPVVARNKRARYADNTYKLHIWADIVDKTDEPMILMDCDTLVLRDPSPVFDMSFDVAVTARPGRMPVNAGVVYVRPNERSRAFFRQWVRINDDLFTSSRPDIDRWGGINQAALVSAMDAAVNVARVARIPCAKWNSVEQTWGDLNDDTVVLHIKGALREMALANVSPSRIAPHMLRAYALWMHYDAIARERAC